MKAKLLRFGASATIAVAAATGIVLLATPASVATSASAAYNCPINYVCLWAVPGGPGTPIFTENGTKMHNHPDHFYPLSGFRWVGAYSSNNRTLGTFCTYGYRRHGRRGWVKNNILKPQTQGDLADHNVEYVSTCHVGFR
jgi:hypothetical protein